MSNFRDISKERKELIEQVISSNNKEEAIKILADVRSNYDWAIPGYRNSLGILSDTTYENRKHFLLELIQNADDAKFDDVIPKMSFQIFDDKLVITYNEVGFSINDLIAITDTGNSTKKSNDTNSASFIGEKGIGFKSVFALAEKIEIRSNGFNFCLHSDKCIIPELIKDNDTNVKGTQLSIYFKDDESLSIIAEEIEKYFTMQFETFLFLQNISNFTFEDKRNEASNIKSVQIKPSNRKGDLLYIESNYKKKEFIKYSEDIIFPKELLKERWDKLTWTESIPRKVSILFPTKNVCSEGKVFCFLPTKVTLPIPIFLQIDAYMKADREKLHDPKNNQWNKYLLSNLSNVIINGYEKLKKSNIENNLIDYIPTKSENDQLKDVFEELMEKLLEYEWIKTNDDQWIKPNEAIIPTTFMRGILLNNVEYRREIEKVLGKKFVKFDWCVNGRNIILDKYKVQKMNEDIFLICLKKCGFPKQNLLDNNKLVELYKEILNMSVFNSDFYFRYRREEMKNSLLKSKIFPIENEGFSSLIDENNTKVFWISTQNKKETGLGELNDGTCRIVNPKYTYLPMIYKEGSEEINKKNEEIRSNNKIVRKLLSSLEIEELRSDNVLSQVQIPAMLKNKTDSNSNFRLLMMIYDNFRVKKKLEEEYLEDLKKIGEVCFESSLGTISELRYLSMPKFLITKEDIFSKLNIPELKIDIKTKENIISKNDGIEKFREFLSLCDIFNKPKAEKKISLYKNSYTFIRENDEVLEEDKNKIYTNSTFSRKIELKKYELDEYMKKLLNDQTADRRILADEIYELWYRNFSDFKYASNIYSEIDKISFGYAIVIHFQHCEKYSIVKLNNWGGVNRNLIPLITINGRLTFPNKAKSIKIIDSNKSNIDKTCLFIDVVFEETNKLKGYSPAYLESLGIKEVNINDLVEYWENNKDKVIYDEILLAAMELIISGVSSDGFMILDKNSGNLVEVEKFKLGKGNYKYLIEEQYGDLGKRFGKLLNLEEESDINQYFGILKEYVNNPNDVLLKKIYVVLKSWSSWKLEDKHKIKQDFDNITQNRSILLLLNNDKLEINIEKNELLVIKLGIKEIERIEIEKAARELGFLLINSNKNIIVSNEMALNDSEKKEIKDLLEYYKNDLEEKDTAIFLMGLKAYGGADELYNNILTVEKLESKIGDIHILLDLPFINEEKKKIYIPRNYSMVNTLSYIINSIGFDRLKRVYKYLNEYKEKKLQEKRRNKKEEGKNIEKVSMNSDIPRKEAPQSFSTSNEENLMNLDISLKEARKQIEDNLVSLGLEKTNDESEDEWNVGLYPEEEEELRNEKKIKLIDSFQNNFEIKEIESRKKDKTTKERNYIVLDKNSIDPKEYLLREYGGKCQVCHEEINLINGSKYIEVYHIREEKKDGWWKDREYNILGFCPNCFVKAKYGGRDFSTIKEYALKVESGDIFPEEVNDFNGDYYVIPVKLNGKDEKLVLSKNHINNFAAFFSRSNEEN